MTRKILLIVEGESEVEGAPVLLRRLLLRAGRSEVLIAKPFKVKRSKVVKPGELENAVLQGTRSRKGVTAVLVLLDADDDDPAILEPALLERARRTTHLPVGVVLAIRELESWFLGSKESLRGIRGIRAEAKIPVNPETIRGAKERLTSNMERGRRYVERDDQPAFASTMDLDLALQHCTSFQRFVNELERILSE